ncbi:hypothetical protein STEG23_004470, partial [Scotinomys teguina]
LENIINSNSLTLSQTTSWNLCGLPHYIYQILNVSSFNSSRISYEDSKLTTTTYEIKVLMSCEASTSVQHKVLSTANIKKLVGAQKGEVHMQNHTLKRAKRAYGKEKTVKVGVNEPSLGTKYNFGHIPA